jgi:hypothetical protein
MRQILFCFLFSISYTFSQSVENIESYEFFGTEISFSYRTRELFHGISYTQIFKKSAFSTGLNLGVKSTYFQGSIFPQLQFKYAFFPVIKQDFKSKNTLLFGPQIQLKSGIQRVSRLHSYSDLLIGYDFYFGRKWQITHSVAFGPYLEIFKTDNRQIYSLSSINYCLTFGLNYAL